jgi:hypothetical protein
MGISGSRFALRVAGLGSFFVGVWRQAQVGSGYSHDSGITDSITGFVCLGICYMFFCRMVTHVMPNKKGM